MIKLFLAGCTISKITQRKRNHTNDFAYFSAPILWYEKEDYVFFVPI